MSVPAGERRPVTALFADIVGSTTLAERLDPEEWSEIVAEAVARMSAAVIRYDGRVEQVLGDGVLAFFGLTEAHEDDPQRAVRAGLDMVDEMRRYSDETFRSLGIRLPIRVGIGTGTVVVRDFGDTAARTSTTALGDPVNVAARMQTEARPDTVLVTGETHAFVDGLAESRPLGQIMLKGRQEPVQAWEIVRWTGGMARQRGIPGLSSPLVGRDEDIASLARLLQPVRAGLGRAAVLVGEPGIGKSRLLAELRNLPDATGVAWHESRCLSHGHALPNHLVTGIVRSLLGLPAPDLGDTLSDRPGAPPPDAPLDPYLAHLLAMDLPTDRGLEIARLDPAVLQARYAAALHRLIADATRSSPVAIVCEDVHWADPASAELLARLVPDLPGLPVLLIATSRPERDSSGWSIVTAVRDVYGDVVADLRLGPLSPEQGRTLVGHLLAIESLPEATRNQILARADGNPFFIEEVVRMLIDRGAIERREDRWVATRPIQGAEIPGTLHGLLLARIDRLSPEARDLLRVASVIGRRFPVTVLNHVLEER